MRWTKEENKIIGSMGEIFNIIPNPYWYVVPTRIDFNPDDRLPRPLDFAMVMHNASIGEGLLTSPTVFGGDLPKKTLKGGVAAEAENILEKIRSEKFPGRPSRLLCYYLNATKEIAEYRMNDSLRGNKQLLECYIVLHKGSAIHIADSGIYERLEGRPEDEKLATTYWNDFTPTDDEELFRSEILVDSSLYFPDWKSFSQIKIDTLTKWQSKRDAQAQSK